MNCTHCDRNNATARCGGCGVAYYCNEACQRAHWEKGDLLGHKYTCQMIAAATPTDKFPQFSTFDPLSKVQPRLQLKDDKRLPTAVQTIFTDVLQRGAAASSTYQVSRKLWIENMQKSKIAPDVVKMVEKKNARVYELATQAFSMQSLQDGQAFMQAMEEIDRLVQESSALLGVTEHKEADDPGLWDMLGDHIVEVTLQSARATIQATGDDDPTMPDPEFEDALDDYALNGTEYPFVDGGVDGGTSGWTARFMSLVPLMDGRLANCRKEALKPFQAKHREARTQDQINRMRILQERRAAAARTMNAIRRDPEESQMIANPKEASWAWSTWQKLVRKTKNFVATEKTECWSQYVGWVLAAIGGASMFVMLTRTHHEFSNKLHEAIDDMTNRTTIAIEALEAVNSTQLAVFQHEQELLDSEGVIRAFIMTTDPDAIIESRGLEFSRQMAAKIVEQTRQFLEEDSRNIIGNSQSLTSILSDLDRRQEMFTTLQGEELEDFVRGYLLEARATTLVFGAPLFQKMGENQEALMNHLAEMTATIESLEDAHKVALEALKDAPKVTPEEMQKSLSALSEGYAPSTVIARRIEGFFGHGLTTAAVKRYVLSPMQMMESTLQGLQLDPATAGLANAWTRATAEITATSFSAYIGSTAASLFLSILQLQQLVGAVRFGLLIVYGLAETLRYFGDKIIQTLVNPAFADNSVTWSSALESFLDSKTTTPIVEAGDYETLRKIGAGIGILLAASGSIVSNVAFGISTALGAFMSVSLIITASITLLTSFISTITAISFFILSGQLIGLIGTGLIAIGSIVGFIAILANAMYWRYGSFSPSAEIFRVCTNEFFRETGRLLSFTVALGYIRRVQEYDQMLYQFFSSFA